MYCMNCGEPNDDGVSFCKKCGKHLGEAPTDAKKIRSLKGLHNIPLKKWVAGIMSIVLVIVAVTVVVPRVSKAGKGSNAVSSKDLKLDDIVEQCPECQNALETYIATIAACQDWTTTKETIEDLEDQKCAQMQHFCTAETIYVEDIPYAYHGSFGLYTGDWVGAGPSGNGTYTGTIYGNHIVTYTGGWGFGMPNGEGQLYLEKYYGTWDMTYTGEMKNGKRDGIGLWFEYDDGGGYRDPVFRVFDEAVYSQDQLTAWTNCVKYNAETGEILAYSKEKTNETGLPIMGETWGPNELSPEMENALGVVGALCIVGVVAYMTGETVRTVTDPHYADSIYKGQTREEQLAELNQYNEKKKAEDQKRLQSEEKKQAQIRQENRDICDKLEAAGKTDSWEYRYAYAYSYY